RALVEQNPDDPGAHFALALALLHADNLAAAELQYRRAAGLPATTPYYILAAAEQASELGFENQALALTAQVFGDIGSDPVLRDHAGALLYDLASDANRLDITVFSRLAEAHPASGGAQAMLTRALTAMSRFDEAQAAIDEALELDGALPETHLILGDLYAATDRPSEAEAEWRYARTASGAPEWVITQANLLLSGNTR
ncbi:MAG: hypothetical protein JW910_00755, partial [Anaerolineae bacterium]|nr:hypothetical protein [Anaerolineae bacterium]